MKNPIRELSLRVLELQVVTINLLSYHLSQRWSKGGPASRSLLARPTDIVGRSWFTMLSLHHLVRVRVVLFSHVEGNLVRSMSWRRILILSTCAVCAKGTLQEMELYKSKKFASLSQGLWVSLLFAKCEHGSLWCPQRRGCMAAHQLKLWVDSQVGWCKIPQVCDPCSGSSNGLFNKIWIF